MLIHVVAAGTVVTGKRLKPLDRVEGSLVQHAAFHTGPVDYVLPVASIGAPVVMRTDRYWNLTIYAARQSSLAKKALRLSAARA